MLLIIYKGFSSISTEACFIADTNLFTKTDLNTSSSINRQLRLFTLNSCEKQCTPTTLRLI